ncbi:MAG: hypothetical protein Q7U54_15245 [Bacteroidales bacterium]|nr:hypothetical protein [Bacteroidales bacterium]
MNRVFNIFGLVLLLFSCKQAQIQPGGPISLHPENPHYFSYRGKSILLITSDQHYGAVTNMDFDYITFLDTLAANGMNFTRIYPGAYIEKDGEYMQDNNLGARNGHQILPWVKTSIPGAHEVLGGYKLDLDQWNDAYFIRLKDFISKAKDRNIIVDIAFFNGMYPDRWSFQALYHANNIQGVGTCAFNEVQTLKDSALTLRHEAYVKKITEEVNEFDNVILDICDEPFQDGCPPDLYNPWISKMIDAVRSVESSLPIKHLIAQTIDSHTRKGPGDFSADSRVNVLENEYTWGIANLDKEYSHNKPMVLIETSYYPQYDGDKIAASRVEAWEFLVGGGAAFMQLNGLYSTFNPGAGGTENCKILQQLKVLKNFMSGLNYIRMRQDTSFVAGEVPEGTFARAISEPGKQYAFYVHHSRYGCWFWEPMKMGSCYNVVPGNYQENMVFNIAPGMYSAEWIDPTTGTVIQTDNFTHDGGNRIFNTPGYIIDIALKITTNENR